MLDIPYHVQELFKDDSISKNFRVTIVHSNYPDLVNADFVSESMKFSESVSSNGKLTFGAVESSTIEFDTYFTENIRHQYIACYIEIDISSLPQDIIDDYGMTTQDVPFVYYRLPLGYFFVDSCKRTGKTGVQKIVAYSRKMTDEDVIYSLSAQPNIEFAKLLWGTRIISGYGFTQYSVGDTSIDINFLKFYFSCMNTCSLLGKPETIYDKTSSVFTRYNNFDYDYPTIKVRSFYQRVNNQSNYYRMYKVCVRGRKLIFGDSKFYTYGRNQFNLDCNGSKQLHNLPYSLSADASKLYELIWNEKVPSFKKSDFGTDFAYAYDVLEGELSDLLKPCVRFADWTTYPTTNSYKDSAYYVPSSVLTSACNYSPAFPLNVPRINTEQSSGYEILPRSAVYENGTKYVRELKRFPYTPANETWEDTIQFSNTNLVQRYIDLDAAYDGENYHLVIDPEILYSDNVTDMPSNLTEEQYKYYELSGTERICPYYIERRESKDYTRFHGNRNIHLEICIPEVITLTSVDIDLRNISLTAYQRELKFTNLYGGLTLNNTEYANLSASYPKFTNVKTKNVNLPPITEPILKQYDVSKYSGDLYKPVTFDYLVENARLNISYSDPSGIEYRKSTSYWVDNYDLCIDFNKSSYTSLTISSLPTFIVSGYTNTSRGGIETTAADLPENLYSPIVCKDFAMSYAELSGKFLRWSRYYRNELEFYYPYKLQILFPRNNLYPADNLYPVDAAYRISPSVWRKLLADEIYETTFYDTVAFTRKVGTTETTISVPIDIEKVDGATYETYDVSDNWLLKNVSYTNTEIENILAVLADVLAHTNYIKLTMNMRGLPYLAAGDVISIIDDNHFITTVMLKQRISGIQSLITDVENT